MILRIGCLRFYGHYHPIGHLLFEAARAWKRGVMVIQFATLPKL